MELNTIIQHNIADVEQFFLTNINNIKEGTKKG